MVYLAYDAHFNEVLSSAIDHMIADQGISDRVKDEITQLMIMGNMKTATFRFKVSERENYLTPNLNFLDRDIQFIRQVRPGEPEPSALADPIMGRLTFEHAIRQHAAGRIAQEYNELNEGDIAVLKFENPMDPQKPAIVVYETIQTAPELRM
jgi:hypothetical protein